MCVMCLELRNLKGEPQHFTLGGNKHKTNYIKIKLQSECTIREKSMILKPKSYHKSDSKNFPTDPFERFVWEKNSSM